MTLSARDLMRTVPEVFKDCGKVVMFGDDKYAQVNVIKDGKVIYAIGVAVKQ